jgi:hypothetical protein
MKLFRRNDHNFLAAMLGEMLKPFTAKHQTDSLKRAWASGSGQ